jgi:hypothetical protein
MEGERARYVLRYYRHLMTVEERLAQRHLLGAQKTTHGRSDRAAQSEARNGSRPSRELLSNDPAVLQLARGGVDAFEARTAKRILDEHSNQIAFTYCPRCGALAKTPKARQCRFCRHDWHRVD